MAIATGQIITTSSDPASASDLIQSFMLGYLGGASGPNSGVSFAQDRLPTQTIPASGARTQAESNYSSLGLFGASTAGVNVPVLNGGNIPNPGSPIYGGTLTSGNVAASLQYPANATWGYSAGSFYGFTNVFYGELRRYLAYRNLSATTTVAGNIPPAGVYSESGKAFINPNFSGASSGTVNVSGWGGGALNPASITNPSSNFDTGDVISASTTGPIGGYNATAFNTYWQTLINNWNNTYTAAGTINITTSVCHGSCHSSCHGSRGRR